MKRRVFTLLIILMLTTTVLLSGCGSFHDEKSEGGSGVERYTDVYFDAFDTVTTFIAYCDSKEAFDELSKEVHETLMEYHRMFDIYNEYDGINNIRTINQSAGKDPVEVDPEVIELIELGIDLYGKTGGRVNIAMGSVLSLWHDARKKTKEKPDQAYIPEMNELEKASNHCEISDIKIDKNAGTVYLNDPEMSLDIGAIGKGFSVEKVSRKLESEGHTNFVISAGGNVRASGTKENEEPWVIAVQNPEENGEGSYVDTVKMDYGSLVTSGVYQRYYEYDGKKYHHIIDSETLMPESRFLSVTIMTDDSGLADALSTGVFNMELEEGQAFIESMDGVEAIWVLSDKTIIKSSGWKSDVV